MFEDERPMVPALKELTSLMLMLLMRWGGVGNYLSISFSTT